jgi:hypothetical protein
MNKYWGIVEDYNFYECEKLMNALRVRTYLLATEINFPIGCQVVYKADNTGVRYAVVGYEPDATCVTVNLVIENDIHMQMLANPEKITRITAEGTLLPLMISASLS